MHVLIFIPLSHTLLGMWCLILEWKSWVVSIINSSLFSLIRLYRPLIGSFDFERKPSRWKKLNTTLLLQTDQGQQLHLWGLQYVNEGQRMREKTASIHVHYTSCMEMLTAATRSFCERRTHVLLIKAGEHEGEKTCAPCKLKHHAK